MQSEANWERRNIGLAIGVNCKWAEESGHICRNLGTRDSDEDSCDTEHQVKESLARI